MKAAFVVKGTVRTPDWVSRMEDPSRVRVMTVVKGSTVLVVI